MSVLVCYINILCRALKPRESKRLQAAGQWSIGALGGDLVILSLRSKPLKFRSDDHHPLALAAVGHLYLPHLADLQSAVAAAPEFIADERTYTDVPSLVQIS